jgi:hypothetical protein
MGDVYDICHEEGYEGPHKFGGSYDPSPERKQELKDEEVAREIKTLKKRVEILENLLARFTKPLKAKR